MGLDPTKPNHAAQQANEAVLQNAKNLANGSTSSNPDFANGKGNDPHARGAESSCDFIMNN